MGAPRHVAGGRFVGAAGLTSGATADARVGLEETVVAIVGDAATVAHHWTTPAAMVFIDGGHGPIPAHADYDGWAHHVLPGGLLAIHDVFPDPADGGRPPYEIYCRALESGDFEHHAHVGSLRVLQSTPR